MLGNRAHMRISQILLEGRLITKRQLKIALERQKVEGHYLGRNLIELGYIDEGELTQYIAEQYRIPYISLARYKVSPDAFNVIPEDMCHSYGVTPLDLFGDILTIAMVDAPDEATIQRIEELTGFKIQVMVISAGDFNRYMEKIYQLSTANKDGRLGDIEPAGFIKMPSYAGKERRRYPRFGKALKIKYEYRDEYNINSSINISLGGILIKSKSPVPENSHIVLRMELPTIHEDVIIITRVARVEKMVNEDIYLVAFSFSSMDSQDHNRLSKFLKSLST